MSNEQVDVTVVNNSGQTATLRFPAGSELPDYLKTLARREELQEVAISAPFDGTDDSATPTGKPKKAAAAAARKASPSKRAAKPAKPSPNGDDGAGAGAGDSSS